MRSALCLCALFLFAAASDAQIFGIWLVDEKAEKKFKKHLTALGEDQVLVCEPWSGISYDPQAGTIGYDPDRNEVFVADPGDPTYVPYEFKDGRPQPRGRKSLLSVQGNYIRRVDVLMANQSLYGLSREYGIRRAEIDELKEARDDQPKGSAAWSHEHMRVLKHLEALRSWLERTVYAESARDLDKELAKERKKARGEASEARLQRALDSIQTVATPRKLLDLSQEITGGKVRFGVAESQHVRITHDLEGVGTERAKELLEFAEKAIDGFRRDFVDPYLDEDYPDHIPDHLFLEFWIGPDRREYHERFYTEYYGAAWGEHKDAALQLRGITRRSATAPEFLDYGKREDHELNGVVAHRVGHVLADLHYNAGELGMKQDWLEEAVGYHIAFEYLGRNDETCHAFQGVDRYAGGVVGEGTREEVTIQLGERYLFNQLALEEGRRIEQVAPMTLYQMGDADLAKAWSFYDYVIREEGKRGQLWLRSACELARIPDRPFLPAWREASAALLEVGPAEVFRVMDDRWRAFAEEGQRTDPGTRR